MKKMLFLLLILSGCTGIPENVEPVRDFELNRYLGKWFEIVRLDHSFERGLSNVTANYTLRDDGGIKVLNRGYNDEEKEWDEAEGKAYFEGDPSIGRLKVSFFGPFYAGYNIIALDKINYSYSMVCGPDTTYFWILARENNLPAKTRDSLIDLAKNLGFPTHELIYVKHDMTEK